ncbi:MAG: GNAT family N-acetyltransferase [Patescibacteria group bacterium]
MTNSIQPEKILIRKVTRADTRTVYDLAMDPVVRKNSFSSSAISLPQHITWFNRKLHDPSGTFLIAEYEGRFAGQVRFDCADGVAIIGISVTAQFRGRKLALPLLQLAIKHYLSLHPEIMRIEAFIKPDNTPSIKLFEKAGFQFEATVVVREQQAKKYIFSV